MIQNDTLFDEVMELDKNINNPQDPQTEVFEFAPVIKMQWSPAEMFSMSTFFQPYELFWKEYLSLFLPKYSKYTGPF